MCDSIFDALSNAEPDVVEVGRDAVLWIHEAFVAASGSHDTSENNIRRNSTLWDTRCETLCHGCHQRQWRKQVGACIGLQSMLQLDPLPMDWLQKRELRILDSLFYVLKNHPFELGLTWSLTVVRLSKS